MGQLVEVRVFSTAPIRLITNFVQPIGFVPDLASAQINPAVGLPRTLLRQANDDAMTGAASAAGRQGIYVAQGRAKTP